APFAGFHALARFALIKIIASLVLGALAWLLFRLSEKAIDSVLAPTQEEHARAKGSDQLLSWWLKAAAATTFLLTGLGAIAVVWGASRSDAASFAADIAAGFDVGGVNVSPVDVLAAVLVFAFGLAAVRFLQRVLETKVLPRTRMDQGAQNALRAGFGYAGVLVALLVAVSAAGFDLTNLAIIAGALSVGIGFGLQTIVNNFVSGLILLIERPFQVGDWIVTGGDEGYVRNIKVRSTEIQTFDNAIITVPNSDLVTGRVLNWTHRDMSGRIIVPVGVAYGTDPETVRQALLTVAAEHPLVQRHPEPFVLFNAFGDSALNFELRVILSDVTKRFQVRSDLHFAIEKKLREHGISVPFPQRDVHIKGLEKIEGALDAFTQAMRNRT
ncbi:MAG TPA: mechanosensitive ion channel, partial [Micropepsaceae bacterium]|nr:mechanosensitive ion channel [Micropepsaceae bacterium]